MKNYWKHEKFKNVFFETFFFVTKMKCQIKKIQQHHCPNYTANPRIAQITAVGDSTCVSAFGVDKTARAILGLFCCVKRWYWIKMGWSGENFHMAKIFMNPPDAGYNPFAFSVSNCLMLVKILSYLQYKLINGGKILLLFLYKSIDIDQNTHTFHT